MAMPSNPMERLSKIVLGQIHRLAVMSWIAQSEDVINPSDLAADLGLPSLSAIQNPLRDLAEAGLIQRLPTTAGRTYYEKVDSSAWSFAEELVASLGPMEGDALSAYGQTPAGHQMANGDTQ
ncbi:MarR family winged helix-turn-helix transcriptional regulator [Gordonia sp. w5E2]|nr:MULTISPECIES: MarR family winged helix-turn-helix transcriptional regulator [Gordonia]MCM3896300.1 MarR family winged helix-turn-helix transcriptional regulator [Gordonia sputi]